MLPIYCILCLFVINSTQLTFKKFARYSSNYNFIQLTFKKFARYSSNYNFTKLTFKKFARYSSNCNFTKLTFKKFAKTLLQPICGTHLRSLRFHLGRSGERTGCGRPHRTGRGCHSPASTHKYKLSYHGNSLMVIVVQSR